MADTSTVLYVDHARAMGGAERSMLELLAAIDLGRYRPVLATTEGDLAARARAQGVPVRIVPLERLKGTAALPARLLRGGLALAHLARTEGANLIHANVYRSAVYAAVAASLGHLPLVWHVRDAHGHSLVAAFVTRRAAATIAISRYVASRLPGGQRATVIYNPVARAASPPRSRESLGLPPRVRLVASVGRLRRWKGHGRFLEAAAQVRHAEAHFVVVGGRIFRDHETDYRPELERLVIDLGLTGRVTFAGHREDLGAIWPHVSVCAHAATAEPFGRVVAEALLAGVPIVGFRDGGIPEIVDDGETGVLLEPGDTEAMAGAIDLLLSDRELAERLAAQGQRRSAQRFEPTRSASAVMALYDRVLAGSPGPASAGASGRAL